MSEKQKFQQAWDNESALTLKLLKAYPQDKTALKPHPSCRSAKDLAWTFVFEGIGGAQAVQGEMKFPPPNMPAMRIKPSVFECPPPQGRTGLIAPVARRADPSVTSGNWQARAGMNQLRYCRASAVVAGSALRLTQ